jgi:D-lactate dehydrogenase
VNPTDLATRSSRLLPDPDPGLIRELEQIAPGAVGARATDRLAYAHDASHYLLTPQAVVTARDADQVAILLRQSARLGIPLTFRSGGTSLSGQASTDAVLVDTRRHFKEMEVLDGGARLRVQPGVTVRQANARLTPYGTKLGPDPASEAACTIGGVVANNSSGMACGTAFNTYNTIASAVLVLASGTVIDTAAADADDRLRLVEPVLYAGLAGLRDRVRGNPDSVRIIADQYAIKNTMGYGLNSFLDHARPADLLLHLVVGSEGTLAFVAEATFRTVPVKTHLSTGLLLFDRLSDATGALPELVASGLATIELLDATALRVSQRDPQADDALRAIRVRDHAALLVEYQEESALALAERTEGGARLMAGLPLSTPAVLSGDAKTRAGLWHIRKGLYATVAGNRPSGTTALLEDIAVPVGSLLATCDALVELFDRHGYGDSVIFGHAKDGNIHFLLNERFDVPDQLNRYIAFTDDMVDVVLGQGGTLKAEHGTGRIMAPFVRRQYGDELYAVMIAVKQLCDPDQILNPGIVLSEDPQAHISHLKQTATVEEEVDRCVECGYCEPVCPSKDLTLTPRQRIVLRRERAQAEAAGDLALVRELEREYAYDGIETCAVDGMCQTACPVLIDTGSLVRRLRAEERGPVEQRAWSSAARHWQGAARLGGTALSVAARVPSPVVSAVNRLGRRILGAENVPLWQRDLPGGGAARRAVFSKDARAVFFPACIGTLFGPTKDGPGVGSAFLQLCRRADVDVATPGPIAGLCCGTPWKSKGFTEGWAEMRDRVLPELWTASDSGRLPIVCDAASCTEGLERLAAGAADHFSRLRFVDAVAFIDEQVLPRLNVTGRLASLALHPTCSSTQLGTNDALLRIGSAVAEEVVVPEGWGCCGFAGDRGLLHPELTAAATAREAASVRERTFSAYASTNRTCELGLTRATGRPYRHILEVLHDVTA